MPRSIAIAALLLVLAIAVPATVFAFTSNQTSTQTAPVLASEDGGATAATESTAREPAGSDKGDAGKPWVGLYLANVTERLADKLEIDADSGTVVIKVVENAPAVSAGIERGDLIRSVAGSDISTVSDVQDAVNGASVGDTLAFTVERDGAESTYTVTVGERPASEKKSDSPGKGQGQEKAGKACSSSTVGIGVTVASLTEALADRLEIDTQEGVAVIAVLNGSPADDAGLQKGDVFISVGGETVDEVSDVVNAVKDAEAGDTLTFVIDRDSQDANLSLSITVAEGYGGGARMHSLPGLGNLRGAIPGFMAGKHKGSLSINARAVTVKEISEDSLVLTPMAEGTEDITVNVAADALILRDGKMGSIDDLAVDDEGMAVIKNGELAVLVVGSLEDFGPRFPGNFHRGGSRTESDADRSSFSHGTFRFSRPSRSGATLKGFDGEGLGLSVLDFGIPRQGFIKQAPLE